MRLILVLTFFLCFAERVSYAAGCASVSIVKDQNLVFNNAAASDAAQTITAANGAQFTVTSTTNNCTYSITTPSDITITGPGSAIAVTTFTKNSGTAYKTNGSKVDTFTIGATRAAMGNPQTAGAYTGTFVVAASCCGNGSTNGVASITAIASIGVSKVSDLSFGTGARNDGVKVVAPASGASFTITGQASTAYTITLPSTATMLTGTGDVADKQIVANTFVSSPATTGTLNGSGSQTLYIGATRAAIRAAQVAGNYTVNFTITVNY